jgi:hypothetical protein
MDDLLNIQCEDNIGGLQLIQFAPVWFFSSFNPLTFKAGNDWINVPCTSETMMFDETSADDDNLGLITITVTGELPKIRGDIHTKIQKYRNHQCLVKCADLYGNLRLAGSLQEPIQFTDKSNTGAGAADANCYKLQWKGDCRRTALFL